VRALEGPAVRDVERPDSNALAERRDGTALRVGEARLPVEPALDIAQADPRDDGDAVVAALAVGRGLVAELIQLIVRKGRVGDLRLLEAQNIRLDPLQPLADPRQAGRQ
jgi:hypothetical protein